MTRLAAVILAAGLALAGCGSNYSPPSSRPSSASATPLPACPSGAPRIQETTGGPWVCAPDGPVTPAPDSAVTPPAPVDTTASLTGNCIMGYESPTIDSNGFPQSQYSGFQAGSPKGSTIDGNYWAPAMAYQLTLTNNSGSTADVTGFAVVFYDASGTEAGSDQQQAQPSFIVPGQSLTWTELANAAIDGSGDGGNDGSIPANAATCDLVQWYGP